MAKKSKPTPKKSPPKYRRGAYYKQQVTIPAPDGLGGVARDAVRWCSQERAMEITGKSAVTVRRWAHGQKPIDVTSLRLLQVWVWGLIPSEAFITRGLTLQPGAGQKDFRGIPQDAIVTSNGHTLTVGDVDGFVWLRQHYQSRLATMDEAKQAAEEAAKPRAQVIPIAPYLKHAKPDDADRA